jgi:hypothetical protein
MSATRSDAVDHSRMRERERFNIDFDGRQLVVRTDLPELSTFFRETYGPALVSAAPKRIGSLTAFSTRRGCTVIGTRRLDWKEKSVGALTHYLKQEVHSFFMSARPDLLWMHSAAIERSGKAILISGPSGVGKSTLALGLCERGWRLFSDDVAPLSMTENVVYSFFQGAMRRINPGRVVSDTEFAFLKRESLDASALITSRKSSNYQAIIFPRFAGRSGATIARVSPAEAALEIIRNITNFSIHKGAALQRACEIVKLIPVYELKYGNAADAVDSLDSLTLLGD